MYLSWQEKTITDFSEKNISDLYDQGFVFTRRGRGVMNQTRSVRVRLADFELTSENKRILRRTENISLSAISLPHPDYDWTIAKAGKDFYEQKFGEKTFSANKIKEILTEPDKSNFNTLLVYSADNQPAGYAIIHENSEMTHYSYPFYLLDFPEKNIGLSMMTQALIRAKQMGQKYFYIGAAQRPTDTYKWQFKNMEWFDGEKWQTDEETLKKILQG